MHSGTGANGSFLLSQPDGSDDDRGRDEEATHATLRAIARQHRKPIPRRQQNCDGRVHSVGGGRRRRRASRVRALDGESLPQDRSGRTGRAAPRVHDDGRTGAGGGVAQAPPTATPTACSTPTRRARIGKKVEQAVLVGLSLTVDGKRVVPAFDAPERRPRRQRGRRRARSRSTSSRASRCRRAREHTLRLDDATPEPQLGETEIRVEESPTTRLVTSHRGPPDGGSSEKETRFLFRGPKFSALEDRSITVVFAAPAPPPRAAAAAASGDCHGSSCPALVGRWRSRWWWLKKKRQLAEDERVDDRAAEPLNFGNEALLTALATQSPVGVPANCPVTLALETRPPPRDRDGDVGHARHLELIEAAAHAPLILLHARDDLPLVELIGQARSSPPPDALRAPPDAPLGRRRLRLRAGVVEQIVERVVLALLRRGRGRRFGLRRAGSAFAAGAVSAFASLVPCSFGDPPFDGCFFSCLCRSARPARSALPAAAAAVPRPPAACPPPPAYPPCPALPSVRPPAVPGAHRRHLRLRLAREQQDADDDDAEHRHHADAEDGEHPLRRARRRRRHEDRRRHRREHRRRAETRQLVALATTNPTATTATPPASTPPWRECR